MPFSLNCTFTVVRAETYVLDMLEYDGDVCTKFSLLPFFAVSFFKCQIKKIFKIVRKYVLKTEGGWIWLTVTCSGGADCVGCSVREVINLLEKLASYLKE